jgi:hypothetical protein
MISTNKGNIFIVAIVFSIIFLPLSCAIDFSSGNVGSSINNVYIVNSTSNLSSLDHNLLGNLQGASPYFHISNLWYNELNSDISNWITSTEGNNLYYPKSSNPLGYYNVTNLPNLNSTGLIKDWNYTGYIKNWNATGLIRNWSMLAIETDPLWSANYSAYNTTWSSTYNSTYNTWAYNQTTAAVNILNGTGLIKDWNSTGYIRDWNYTGLIINWSIDTSLFYLKSNPSNYWNSTFALFNKTYADSIYGNGSLAGLGSVGAVPLWNGTTSLNNSIITQSEGNIKVAGQLNMTSQNITTVDCITFKNGGSWCSL